MSEKEIRFIEKKEAINHIARELINDSADWHQLAVFARVYGFLSGNTVRPGTREDPVIGYPEAGIWCRTPGDAKEIFHSHFSFKELFLSYLPVLEGRIKEIAKIYQWAFWVNAYPGKGPDGEDGIHVETEMEKFECVRCGNCCLNLGDAFQTSVDMEVVRRWETEGRWDILDRIEVVRIDGKALLADIWFSPVTGDEVSRCPWLRKLPNQTIYKCRIHDTKPPHCLDYPKSKKHALTTGCKGFGDDHTFEEVQRELKTLFENSHS